MSHVRLERIIPNPSKKEINILRRWRVANQKYYQTQVVITKRGFKKWLYEQVIYSKERALWWVICRGIKIGHVGLYKRPWGWEIDNVLRGRSGFKGAMGEAIKMLRDIAGEMGIVGLSLRTLEWNTHAIEFYERLGFKKGLVKDGFVTMS